MLNTYSELIELFMHQQAQLTPLPSVRFEAIVAAVLGTKQRRFGPVPDAEVQVEVRRIVRESGDAMTFFVPWGSRKQTDGMGLDVLEFMALQQLYCLKKELERYDVASRFVFRLEDLTDRYLFGDTQATVLQSQAYLRNFRALAKSMLVNVDPHLESQFIDWRAFDGAVDQYAPAFFKVLQGEDAVEKLAALGWSGTLPAEQRKYYADAYRAYWPDKTDAEINWEMAKYFAATLARVKANATAAPSGPHLLIAFTHPVPSIPATRFGRTRLHYRTIPQRYTNNHRSPWIGKGYFVIHEDNAVVPKSAAIHERHDYVVNRVAIGGAEVEADYVLA